MNRALLASAFALMLLAVPAGAVESVTVSANSFVVDEATSSAVFTGKVHVTHPLLKLTAQKVVVRYGDGGTSDIESFEASGKVSIRMGDQSASGQVAVYDVAGQTLRLSGKVKVKRGKTVLTGPDLLINLVTNTTTFNGGGNGRVTGVFSPQ